MTEYIGARNSKGTVVWIVESGIRRKLPRRFAGSKVYMHSCEFEWGYAGSGPSQLAFSLCFNALDGDLERAARIYMDFKFRHVAGFDHAGWKMTKDEVVAAIKDLEAERERKIATA